MSQLVAILSNVQIPDLGIGYLNDLIYHLPEDLKMFKELTWDQVVIMGRKTWESLPPKARPLPGRINIVITSNPALITVSENVFIAATPEQALELAKKLFPEKDIWIIGGAGIYEALLHKCSRLCLTEVPGKRTADTFFPSFREHFSLADEKSYVSKKEDTSFYVRIYEKL